MENGNNSRARKIIEYLIIFAAVILIVLIIVFVLNYLSLRRADFINQRELRFNNFLRNRGPLTASDVGIISSWMTFDYINKIFNIPADYLKNRLAISDGRYPRISLKTYAREKNSDVVDVLTEVRTALYGRLAAAQATSTSQ